jgi:hypothetical protein
MHVMSPRPAFTLLAAFVAFGVCAAPLQAKLAWKKKATEFDPAVTSCIDCHTKEKPKKNDPLNERGEWLVEQKKVKQAKDVDLSWLKDYPKNGQKLPAAK